MNVKNFSRQFVLSWHNISERHNLHTDYHQNLQIHMKNSVVSQRVLKKGTATNS